MPNSGILLVDKPMDMTSHDLVNIARKVFHTKKIGHTGTLDPDATGVMVLCINQATRLNEYLTADDKRYQVTIKFGEETDTQDISGTVVKTASLPTLDRQAFEAMLETFVGEQLQTPPLYSAIKKDGKPLYKYARAGIDVGELPQRAVTIYGIDCLAYDGKTAVINVHCSKGTYIRTLCQDIGRRAESAACMSALRRETVGDFSLENCLSVEALKASDHPYELLLPMNEVLDMPELIIPDQATLTKIFNGNQVGLQAENACADEMIKATYEGQLIAVGKQVGDMFQPKKVFQQ
ncbi:MAG: tRNA pseudouridine(55) synthase TruB [Peptococcaceae bacterium]|nr:tRNA pseudouridine(55) synthase TruB [Peptococcaceae bacterium]